MSDGLERMPGFRAAPTGELREGGSLLTDLLPFLPPDYDAAMPLYVSMGLLFVVISRVARRKQKVRLRQRSKQRSEAARQPLRRVIGAGPRLRPNDGHWGDGPV